MQTRIVAIAVTLLCLTGCEKASDPNAPTGIVQVKGSDTLVNAEMMLSEAFSKEYKYISVAVTGGGSGVGIASLINKTCNIAAASREIKKKEIEIARGRGVEPKEFVVAYDGIAVIVNHNNPVSKLTINDLHKIYTGEATNWKEFGGKDMEIVTLSREVSSGTHMYFKEEVVRLKDKNNTQEFSPGTLLLSSSQAIVEEVVSNESAIGYLGMGYVSERTKTLELSKNGQFYLADMNNVLKKNYPLSRPLYFYTNGEPNGITKMFIDFTLSMKGQEQFKESGFVPLGVNVAKEN
jgi:phosphate transport system substrate-binding protein